VLRIAVVPHRDDQHILRAEPEQLRTLPDRARGGIGQLGFTRAEQPVVVPRPQIRRAVLQIAEQTYYRWRNQFGGLKADDAKRLKELERENATLKRPLADAELEKAALEEIARGNF
jgi:hypothetical protein